MNDEQNQPVEINWKSYLDILFPALGGIYLSNSQMKEVNARLSIRNENPTSKPNYSTTIYDLLIHAIATEDFDPRRKVIAFGLLNCLEENIKEFYRLTNNDQVLQKQLKDQLDGLFFDNAAKYLNQVGELLSYIHLIKTFHNARLSSLKFHYLLSNGNPMMNGKDADMMFLYPDGRKAIIDIVSVDIDHEKIDDEAGFTSFLDFRVQKKWHEKKFDDLELPNRFNEILIQPFIWLYHRDSIDTYRDFLRNYHNEKSLPLLMLTQASNASGQLFYYAEPL